MTPEELKTAEDSMKLEEDTEMPSAFQRSPASQIPSNPSTRPSSPLLQSSQIATGTFIDKQRERHLPLLRSSKSRQVEQFVPSRMTHKGHTSSPLSGRLRVLRLEFVSSDVNQILSRPFVCSAFDFLRIPSPRSTTWKCQQKAK
jgi:hypothetical protein